MQFSFDATTIAPDIGEGGGFIPVSTDPRGTLVTIIDAGDGNGNLTVQNKAGNGGFMPLKVKIMEGPDAGKEGLMRLNLQHEKPNVQMRAWGEMSAICYVTGVMRIQQSIAEIFHKPFRLVSELQDANKPEGYTQLAMGGIRDVNGNKAGKAGQGPQAAQPQQQQPQQQFQQPQGQQPQQFQQPQQQFQPGPGPQVQPGQVQQFQQPQQPQQPDPNAGWGQPAQMQPQQPQGGNFGGGQPAQQFQPLPNGGAPSWATTPGQ